MARKKKEDKVVAQEESLVYKGEITLTTMHGNKAIRKLKKSNTGKGPLFQYLMYCLTGTLYPTKVPKYLRVFDASDNELTTREIPTTGTPSYAFDSSSASAVITFNLSSTALRQLTGLKKFRIYSSENASSSQIANYSAEVILDTPETVTDGSILIVAWKMTLSNKVGA